MGYLKTNGIVIKEINTDEADKIVKIFTKDYGKISAFAKGAKRTRSTLCAGTQLFSYSTFTLFKSKDIYTINSCEIIEQFYEIRNDLVKLTYAAHLTDLINDVIQENEVATRVLQLFLNSLHMLAKTEKSPELIIRIFEFRLMYILGYSPYVRGCISCNKDNFEGVWFSFNKCGFLCNNCLSQDNTALKILPGTAKTINYVITSKANKLFKFDISEEVLNELGKISKRYLRDRLEREYNKLDFLKYI